MGLIDGAMAPPTAAGAPPPAAAGAPAPGPAGGAPKADPAMVQRVVLAAAKIIHDPKASQALIEQMKQIGDPAQALAQVTIMIMQRIYEASGKKIPPEALGEAGVEVLQMLAQLAQTAKLFQITMPLIQQAAKLAMDMASKMGGQGQASPTAGEPATAAPPAAPAGGMQQQATA